MFNKPPAKPGSASGMEMMFRSLGLGPILDAALEFTQKGGVQKITEFADALPEINARLARIEAALGTGPFSVEPGSGSDAGEHAASGDAGSLEQHSAVDGRSPGKPNGAAHA